MKRPWVVGLAAALLGAGGAAAGFLWYQDWHESSTATEDELTLARDCLTSAKTDSNATSASGLLTQALAHARKAASLSGGQTLDTGLIEGEALILLTKYSTAVEVLEALVAAHPESAAAAELAADAHRESYRIAKRELDFSAAMQLYEKAVDLGAPPSALVSAARFAESTGHHEWTDRILESLEGKFPSSDELTVVKGLKAERAGAPESR
jgi:tetratricopeptide (TPR) repeat protein